MSNNYSNERKLMNDNSRRKKYGMDTETIIRSTFENDRGWCNEYSTEKAREYARNFQNNRTLGKGLLMWGKPGVGKSYLSYCIANSVFDMTHKVRNYLGSDNFIDLNDHYNIYLGRTDQAFNEYCRNAWEFIDRIRYLDLVIISDLGREADSDRMTSFFNSWIDILYEEMIPLVITTNLTISEMMSSDRGLPAYDRIFSRSEVVEVRKRGSKTARQMEREEMMKGTKPDASDISDKIV